MQTPTLSQLEKLKKSFAPLQNEILNNAQEKMIYDKLDNFTADILKDLCKEKIYHISDIAAQILMDREEISEKEYCEILDSM